MRADAQCAPIAERIASSAGIVALVTAGDDEVAWVEAGRRVERFALQADLLGIRTAFINQPIEVAELRPRLEAALDVAGPPN